MPIEENSKPTTEELIDALNNALGVTTKPDRVTESSQTRSLKMAIVKSSDYKRSAVAGEN